MDLLHAGADRSAVDALDRNALHLACMAGDVIGAAATLSALLERGFAVDAPDARGGRPLLLARTGRLVRLLLQHGAEPRLSDAERRRLGAVSASRLEGLSVKAGTAA